NISHKRRDFVLKLGKAMGLAGASGLTSSVLAKQAVQARATIKSISLEKSGAGKLRLIFALDKRIKHKILTLKSPDRIVVDFLNTGITNKPLTLGRNKASQFKLIRKIRQSKRNDNDYRIVLDMAKRTKATTRLKTGKSGVFLEVVLSTDIDASIKRKAIIAKKSKKKAVNAVHRRAKQKPLIIAIDAGHGGRDPGAVGKKGTKEKTIALQIAKRLKKRIDRQPGMQAVLIRDADYYIRLDKRIAKARTKRADVFVSIHADANPNRRLTGSSVYILSESGASSAAAKWLAKSENSYEAKMADTHLQFKNKVVSSVLLDLSLSETIDRSLDLASNVLKELGGVNHLLRRRVESASFAVLKSPDIPSMLVETAFISNPMEEKRLKTSHYQEKLAKAIFKGVRKYQVALNSPNSRYT
ncbi:MAG TPA: AMIN domain-containing protein, partial [Leucothrix sp.]|nr:AMIN domain-containing protein [Leucothrix sp.]